MPVVGCTIVATNYLAQARVLARSFARHHPRAEFVVAVIDDPTGRVDVAGEPFSVLGPDAPPLATSPARRFQYTVLELATAQKPALLAWLLAEGADRVLYLDPDCVCYAPLDPCWSTLERHPIALTPHALAPLPDDGCYPAEVHLARTGAFNGGCVGVAAHPDAMAMLAWWADRCRDHCVVRPDEGYFVDQKWLDLVPARFPSVGVVTDRGCNVAHWNLHERPVAGPPDAPRLPDGTPVRFFHFSGYDPAAPARLSRHQNRFTLDAHPAWRALHDAYAGALRAAGWDAWHAAPYGWGRFADGRPVAPVMRDGYWRLGPARERFGDPFRSGPGTFQVWLQAPAEDGGGGAQPLSNLERHILRFRPDLPAHFPDPAGHDRPAFRHWLRHTGAAELGLDGDALPVGGPGP